MPPSARITDMHVCPMVTGVVPHVGGPILPPGCPTVLIGGLPAARITDMATCVGPPDVILMGSPTVLIGNLMAARIGDPTVHGGVIVLGCPTVIIGEAGAPSPSAAPGQAGGKGAGGSAAVASAKDVGIDDAGGSKAVAVVGPDPIIKWREGKKDAIEKALAAQCKMLETKKAELAEWDNNAKAKFKKAFGKDDDKSRKAMQVRIDRMLEVNKNMKVDNFKPADPSKPGRFAYVYPNDDTHIVYLDEAFDNAPEEGQDSKAGALAHEMSHFDDVGGTHDKFKDYNDDNPVYGQSASRQLAKDHPDLAMKHADSFEYYVEDNP